MSKTTRMLMQRNKTSRPEPKTCRGTPGIPSDIGGAQEQELQGSLIPRYMLHKWRDDIMTWAHLFELQG